MAFKGLFIGIDRYDSPEINWLSCANRDATALHALFTDTLGGETMLLTDEQATVAAIRERFEQLAACDPDAVVVIAFSGHGTETHELVGHDTDPYDLARTAIPLPTLGEWCARIPGKTMLGELAAVRGALDRRRTLFLLPLKALVSDKLRQFQRVYGPFGIRTIEATGETDDISPLLRGRYDIALLTYEKFSAIALTNPHVLEQVGIIVIDEVQMTADESRGANLEFILTLRGSCTPLWQSAPPVVGR